ncbi:dihydrofolate reductase family protein [Erysipelotrichaceae bacterium RD49]|nr:dihydrofolate reductase family protein [Erysipelotrichaceae bacterium RD49]
MIDSETIEARQVSEKLYSRFGIEKMLICGGRMTDWTFLSVGMVDELSMFLIPGADGDAASASVFECAPGLPQDQTVSFALKDVEKLKDGILHLVYIPNNIEA